MKPRDRKRSAPRPTVEQLRTLFTVTEDGRLLRLVTTGSNGRAGTFAGNPNAQGYLQLEVLGYSTTVHRVVYTITRGAWPSEETDHIDGDRTNNRPANLRDVSRAVNQQNQRRPKAHNRTGLLGVTPGRRGRFRATIIVNGKQRSLGTFNTPELASDAYQAAKRESHAGFVP